MTSDVAERGTGDDKPLPQGVELTPLDEHFREDPYAVLKGIQQRTRVLEDAVLKRFIYTDHDDVKEILRDRDFWSDPRKANPGTFTRQFLGRGQAEDEEPSMLLMDEPGHRRLRSLVSASFTPAAVEKWRGRARAVVERVLDGIDGEEFDLIGQFAGPVPTVVIAELLGIDAAMHADFKRWSDLSVKVGFNPFATDEEHEAGEQARVSLEQFFREEIARRRENPGTDLISDMIRAEEGGDKLTAEEMVRQCNLLLVAGNVTTTDLIGNGVKALLDHPEQWALLRERPELIKNAVEEMLRFDSPVVNSGRIANRDIEIGGCPVHKGESLNTSLAAANRDPKVYPEPDKFDITRDDTHHQSFGGGRHLCLGAHLARVEAQEAILGLMSRFPNLAPGKKGHTYHAIPSFRGMSQFWVRA
ncbi:MAG: cytochrome P450 [Pseudomonadales bacterium]|nr:cytochrome P450 [Pseudomonadales bacterium]